ncbi:MAG TPA: LPS export ABC transporter periplasmic protein LptC [Vicinamibacterales bacterium]|nr:LPS export ABC transporter periplasmic protein LptC [Vicinamibacterales bacterium]
MTTWQRHARAVLAIVAAGVVGTVAYTLRPREIAAPPPKIERTDPNAVVEVQGGDAVQLKGKDQDLRVEYQIQTTNKDGETVLRGAKIMVNNRGGRNYVVTGDQAFIGKENASFDVRGNVRMETDDGLVATSQQATYTDAEKMVRIPGEVRFSQGRMSGSGIGFTFDEQRDVMWILDKADVKFAAEKNLGPMAFTAGAFGYARRDRYMRFEKTMHMERDNQIIDAESAMVRMFPDRDDADYVELRNNARVTGSGTDSALKSMSARDINLDYMDDGRTLQNATLAGSGEIQVASKNGALQKLAGDFMDIGMDPDGSLRHLSTRDRVVVTLPATQEYPARTIRANAMVAAGNANGIREMKFSEGVEYREPGPKAQAGRTVRARNLEAALVAANGTLAEAKFVGNVDFTDGPLHATSGEARYAVEAGTLALYGQSPHVESDALTIDAAAIDVTLNPRRMTAKGNVRSTLLPPKKPAAGVVETRRPALLTDSEAVNVISNEFTYDETTRKAEYKGQTRLLQGLTTINATNLTLDELKGDLTATGKVVTNLAIASGKPVEGGAPAKPMIARAETFTYSDQTRTATYSTTAQLDGDQGHLSAGQLELQLAKTENTLQKLEATTAVTAIVDRRTVKGTRLTYTQAEEKYFFTGAPVTMVDAECKETSGKTLTFWKGSDRVQVDGNNEVRTQTKGGGKCVAVPPQ